jgi:hypothetical protein
MSETMGELCLLGKMESAELLKEIEFWGDQPPLMVCRCLSFGSLNLKVTALTRARY